MSKFDLIEFEEQRAKLASGLTACAEQMRNTAQLYEDFAMMLGALGGNKGKHRDLEDGDGSKKRKRAVKPKDPNAPKRPASSYILYQNEVRHQLKEEFPHLSNPELLALVSERWKAMPGHIKEGYNQKMQKAKQEYSEAKSAYDARSPEEVEAANKAVADAAASKKANRGSRGKSVKDGAIRVAAPPPPPAEPESDEEEEDSDDDEEEEEPKPAVHKPQYSSEGESESSDEESEPVPKRKRGESAQPTKKSTKKSKA